MGDAAASRILIVDDDESVRSVISDLLTDEGYACDTAAGAEQALELASAGFEVILCDIKLPVHDGLWLLDRLRQDFEDIPVIMLTGVGDTDAAIECLRRGATDYLLKPPRVAGLVQAIERARAKRRFELSREAYQAELEGHVRVKTAQLQQAVTDLEEANSSVLYSLVAALDAREHETSNHSRRVAGYTASIAAVLGIQGTELADIGRGALLHDIGKVGVPDAVLLKRGPLKPAEMAEVQRHPELGYRILAGIRFLAVAAELVLLHHERFDGTGYPRKLAGQDIPIGARIFMVADTLDSITSDRPYRRGSPLDVARQEIERCAGSQFDRDVVRAFLSIPGKDLEEIRAHGRAPAGLTDPSVFSDGPAGAGPG